MVAFRFVTAEAYQALFAGTAEEHVLVKQSGIDGYAVPNDLCGHFLDRFQPLQPSGEALVLAELEARQRKQQTAAAAAAVSEAASAAIEGGDEKRRKSGSGPSGVGYERRVSAVKASLNKALIAWTNFSRVGDRNELKRGKCLKTLEDLVKTIDRQAKELVNTECLDAELPHLTHELSQIAAMTSMLCRIGSAMRTYAIKGSSSMALAALEPIFEEVEKSPLVKPFWQNGKFLPKFIKLDLAKFRLAKLARSDMLGEIEGYMASLNMHELATSDSEPGAVEKVAAELYTCAAQQLALAAASPADLRTKLSAVFPAVFEDLAVRPKAAKLLRRSSTAGSSVDLDLDFLNQISAESPSADPVPATELPRVLSQDLRALAAILSFEEVSLAVLSQSVDAISKRDTALSQVIYASAPFFGQQMAVGQSGLCRSV